MYLPKLQSAFVLSGQPCHFQMEKGKENSYYVCNREPNDDLIAPLAE